MSTSFTLIRRAKCKTKKAVSCYKCSVCEYTSERFYNVTRHEFRIHSESSKRRECCDLFFATKGDYYLHCEEHHPFTRVANQTSRLKYKIFSGCKLVKSESSESPETRISDEESRAPYMLRNRVRSNANSYAERSDDEVGGSELTSESPSSYDETEIKSDRSTIKSSSNGAKSSFLDINQNDLILQSSHAEIIDTEVRKSMGNDEDEYLSRKFDEPMDDDTKENSEILHSRLRQGSESNFEPQDKTIKPEGEYEKKWNFKNIHSSSSVVLPIKKRILQDITFLENQKLGESEKSIVERLNLRITNDDLRSLKSRRKRRSARKMKENVMAPNTSSDSENNAPSSWINGGKPMPERKINENVQVLIDPRISWHDFTRVHREYVCSVDFDSFHNYR